MMYFALQRISLPFLLLFRSSHRLGTRFRSWDVTLFMKFCFNYHDSRSPYALGGIVYDVKRN